LALSVSSLYMSVFDHSIVTFKQQTLLNNHN